MARVTVREAAAAIHSGALVVVPTDTVYGIGGRPESAAEIFDLKSRPREKALPVLGCDVPALAAGAELDDRARVLADEHWPGPLTLVVPRAPAFTADLGGTDRSTVAVRIPAHPVALELLRATGPLAVTSANVSGEPPATTYDQACALAPDLACLDGGDCDGVPSTVLGLVGEPRVLREGAIEADQLLERARRLRPSP